MMDLPFALEKDAPASKRAVLKAALSLFVQRGLCETTIRDIAAASGFTNPVLFKYFRSKDELAAYLYRECYRRLSDELWGVVQPQRSLWENVRALIVRCTEVMDDEPELFLFVQENVRQFWPSVPATLRKRSLVRLVWDLFARAIRQGELEREAEPKLLVAGLFGLLGQFARMFHFGEFDGTARSWAPRLEHTFRGSK